MKLFTSLCALGLAATAVALTSTTADSAPTAAVNGVFEVTITNITRGQIFAPALLATHNNSASVFTPGGVASSDLATLAEDGDTSLLLASLALDANVLDVQAGAGMIHPGMSETILITSDVAHPFISVAGMMVSTNDTFYGADSALLPLRYDQHMVPAWDAGSEANSEDCAFIPGPPCGMGGVHDAAVAEGFIHISNGIHGKGGVAADEYDWRNPVARVTVQRIM